MFLLLVITGCVSQEQLAHRRTLESNLSQAHSNALVTCTSKPTCDKAFSLAKVYVQTMASMKVQFSDDTTISTYNANDWDRIALSAMKVPGAGDSATIQLSVSCYKMAYTYEFEKCARRMISIYNGFKEFVESRLK